jgi:hypothetical protein
MSYSEAKAKHDAKTVGAVERDAQRMCSAHGCPNLWSVDVGHGRLCSAHAAAEPSHWPEITQSQQWHAAERARWAGEPQPVATSHRTTDPARLRVLLRRFADHVRVRDQAPKRWAWKLKAREEADPASVNDAQRAMWREALRADITQQQIAAEDAAAEVTA